jgi:hypothetical protein
VPQHNCPARRHPRQGLNHLQPRKRRHEQYPALPP